MNHVLYRFFDEEENLLYIGITGDVWNRCKQHSKTQLWWSSVSTATFEHYENRIALEHAEKIAIHNERPKHNVIHNSAFRSDPMVEVLNKIAALEARLERLCDYRPPASPTFPELMSKKQFLDCTGLTEAKFNLMRKMNLLPPGAFKIGRHWKFNRDKAIEFSAGKTAQLLRLNTLEQCTDILKRHRNAEQAEELRHEYKAKCNAEFESPAGVNA